jgi:uracil-DNA glycosylase
MANFELAKRLISTLPNGSDGLFNPWTDICPDDLASNGSEVKLERLAEHLDCNAQFILCGEAVGFAGGRHSGLAFTSERLLLEGLIPRVTIPTQRLSIRKLPFSEPSATIVWKVLHQLGISEHTILWNSLQLHPYKKGNIRSNRTPTRSEVLLGSPALSVLIDAFPQAKIVAVGRKAEELLQIMGIKSAASIRHPANGGATVFAKGLSNLVGKT